ncbi:MAG: DUF3037 domain-containing protein, partial [Candidatus Binataceae bacterium]
MNADREFSSFFSAVRFVPDEYRAEGANVGVVLLCPEQRRLKWRFTENHKRARRLFPPSALDLQRLRVMQAGLEEHMSANLHKLVSVEAFASFAKSYRNQLQVTDPRSCVIVDFDSDFERLFVRLVADDSTAERPFSKGLSLSQLRAFVNRRLHD